MQTHPTFFQRMLGRSPEEVIRCETLSEESQKVLALLHVELDMLVQEILDLRDSSFYATADDLNGHLGACLHWDVAHHLKATDKDRADTVVAETIFYLIGQARSEVLHLRALPRRDRDKHRLCRLVDGLRLAHASQ